MRNSLLVFFSIFFKPFFLNIKSLLQSLEANRRLSYVAQPAKSPLINVFLNPMMNLRQSTNKTHMGLLPNVMLFIPLPWASYSHKLPQNGKFYSFVTTNLTAHKGWPFMKTILCLSNADQLIYLCNSFCIHNIRNNYANLKPSAPFP